MRKSITTAITTAGVVARLNSSYARLKWRSVPEKISDFLIRRQGGTYCDTCIQERLGLKWRQQVQLITATLAVTECFKRELGRCRTCDDVKQVIQAVYAAQGTEARCASPAHSATRAQASVKNAAEPDRHEQL